VEDRKGFLLYEGIWLPAILHSNGGWELTDNNFKPTATYLMGHDEEYFVTQIPISEQ